jgi:WhiB family redox-sensing transcriptional regulator
MNNDSRWEAKALCAEVDPELFFPEVGSHSRGAKSVCKSCEVTEQCLTMALGDPHLSGVWGGTTDRERTRIRQGIKLNA